MRFRPLAVLVLALAAARAFSEAPAPAPLPADLETRAHAALARPDLAGYRGWIKYLLFRARSATVFPKPVREEAQSDLERLNLWLDRIEADPRTIETLRGVHEWAYESPVDDSGQPFVLRIPADYDPARPAPLVVSLHGYSCDHVSQAQGMVEGPGEFDLAVLARARGGWFTALSQADVLHAMAYVEAHWRIDPARVRVRGTSMGGGATVRFAARYPHRFASAEVACGYAAQEPLGNCLTVPIYAIHSDDDWVVPIIKARTPLREMRRLGASAILDETHGLGHAIWTWEEGKARSAAWAARQVRPASRAVRRLDFTALDGGAMRAWWAEIAEWGPAPRPARFRLHCGNDSTLFAELDNIARLRLRLSEAPVDRSQPLRVIVGGAPALEHPAPLPDTLLLAATPAGWVFETAEPATPWPLHTPGGPVQVYDGTPLLIVPGTSGSPAARAAMRRAAVAASRGPNPAWVGPEGDIFPETSDRTPHHVNMYGALRIANDVDITDADMQRCNLVLIGTAEENAVVRRLAGRLPVRFAGGRIACSDAFDLPSRGRTAGLVHYNPDAPRRLVFWVASDSPDGYDEGALVSILAAGGINFPVLETLYLTGADFLVTGATDRMLVATRSFDSRWRWAEPRDASPLLPPAATTRPGLALAMAEAARRSTGADFAMAWAVPCLGDPPVCAGVTRVADLASLCYGHGIDVLEFDASELAAAAAKIAEPVDNPATWRAMQPALDPTALDPRRRYRVAVPVPNLTPWVRATHTAPRHAWRSDRSFPEALERFLAAP